MSAAHELADRGFEVEVLEARDIPGGKARSMPAGGTGTDGRPDLPAEHGFRFFPGFYRHLPDTMSRIPCTHPCPDGEQHNVADHLVEATEMQVARRSGRPIGFNFKPGGVPVIGGAMTALSFVFQYRARLKIPEKPFADFVRRLLYMMLRSDEWFGEYERNSWLDVTGAGPTGRYRRNRTYRKYLVSGLTQTMVAARADEIGARTAGCTAMKLVQSLSRMDGKADRVLNGPTNDVWIDPWRAYLECKGVVYRTGQEVARINCAGNRITDVRVGSVDGPAVKADYYVCALPVEVMKGPLVSDAMRDADPIFSTLHRLQVRWMNGIMYYLREDIPQIHGHTIYVDSPWALTSISQRQFWDRGLADRGDGRVRGILSVDVSDWKEGESGGRTAARSTRDQIARQVLAQLRTHLDDDPAQQLHDDNLAGWFLDPAICHENPVRAMNQEPLLINTPNSWSLRPQAQTEIENLFLAADYVRTDTDLATMEGANEAARKAVNGILAHCGRDDLCKTWEWEPPVLAKAQEAVSYAKRLAGWLAGIHFHPAIGPDGELALPDLEGALSENPGARVADRMLLEIAAGDPGRGAWELDERELEVFARALVDSPQKTLEAMEDELEDPRPQMSAALAFQ